jgi:hypothetical protein
VNFCIGNSELDEVSHYSAIVIILNDLWVGGGALSKHSRTASAVSTWLQHGCATYPAQSGPPKATSTCDRSISGESGKPKALRERGSAGGSDSLCGKSQNLALMLYLTSPAL